MTTIAPTTTQRYSWGDRLDEVTCIHGRHIGWPGGPDYLCGYCEDSAWTRHETERYEMRQTLINPNGKRMSTYPVNMHGSDAEYYGWDDPLVVWQRLFTLAVRDQQLIAKYEEMHGWTYEYEVVVERHVWWE